MFDITLQLHEWLGLVNTVLLFSYNYPHRLIYQK
jgi:hypothetical protein